MAAGRICINGMMILVCNAEVYRTFMLTEMQSSYWFLHCFTPWFPPVQ
jgi:hypothetical protein